MNVHFENPTKIDFTGQLHVVSVGQAELKTPKKQLAGEPFSFRALDRECSGELSRLLASQKFKPESGKTITLHLTIRQKLTVVLVVGGDEKTGGILEVLEGVRKVGASVAGQAQQVKASKVSMHVPHLSLSRSERLCAFLEGLRLAEYRFTQYKSKDEDKPPAIEDLCILQRGKLPVSALREAEVLSDATALARNLINTPPCDCTPASLVEESRRIAQARKLKLEVFDQARLERLKAGALLAVARGSSQPPYLVKLTYRPSGKPKKVISLIGKGITFDSGGLSIKTAKGMEDMKIDMSGAAAVLGAMDALAVLKPRVEVRAYIPLTENMISGSATKPGDIVRALNGKTIEILNTDAEGRLILADALAMAERDKCDVMVDLATLTGACMVALGSDYAGIFSDSEMLRKALISAGELEGERLWPLPLAKEYVEQLKSGVADLKNIGGSYAGAITAALFLKEFVEKTNWAHLDIAGPASTEKEKGYLKSGGVGFGVRTLVRYILKL